MLLAVEALPVAREEAGGAYDEVLGVLHEVRLQESAVLHAVKVAALSGSGAAAKSQRAVLHISPDSDSRTNIRRSDLRVSN